MVVYRYHTTCTAHKLDSQAQIQIEACYCSRKQLIREGSKSVPSLLQLLQTSKSLFSPESLLIGTRSPYILMVSPFALVRTAHDAEAIFIIFVHFFTILCVCMLDEFIPTRQLEQPKFLSMKENEHTARIECHGGTLLNRMAEVLQVWSPTGSCMRY